MGPHSHLHYALCNYQCDAHASNFYEHPFDHETECETDPHCYVAQVR